MSWRRDLVRARTLPATELRSAIEAVVWLGVLRVALGALPWARLAAWLRLSPSPPGGGELTGGESPGKGTVGWAVRAAAARAPWHSSCLVQSLAGYVMLRHRHRSGVVFFGVARGVSGEMVAHSWLVCDDEIVTGGEGRRPYSAIAAYRPT